MSKPMSPDHYLAVKDGQVVREMNRILVKVGNGEPSAEQRQRLQELKEERRQIRSGDLLVQTGRTAGQEVHSLLEDPAGATAPERWTSCSCPDGQHHDPKAATRSHAKQTDAGIIARHTGRHVVPVSAIRTEVAA